MRISMRCCGTWGPLITRRSGARAARSVTVQVRDGVVTLRGSLREPELIPAAVRLASDVDGVVAVTEEFTSRPAETASGRAAAPHA